MKNQKEPVCPGCSRHCPYNAVRCKYGRAYFAKHPVEENACPSSQKGHKWKAYVSKDGLMWNWLTTAKALKKALCHQKVTEAELLSLLSEEEKQTFLNASEKLRNVLNETK